MNDHDVILAIDQGGQSTRAIVFDRQGNAIANRQVPIKTIKSANGYIEHDPDELVASARTAIDTVLKDPALAGRTLRASGLATQRSTVVCWDRHSGRALSPVISWQDTRAAEVLQRYAPPENAVRQITGLVRSPHYGASKLRWCLDNLDAVKQAQKTGSLSMGPLSSFLLFHLVDERPLLADPVNASRTLLWDINKRDWSDAMLTAFGLSREWLPTCVNSQHDYGALRGTGTPLLVCTGDQSAAIFAGGEMQRASAYVNIGTGAFILAATNHFRADSRLLRSVVWSDGKTVLRVLEGTVNGAGSAVAEASAADIGRAADSIATEDVPMFLNGVSGIGSPYWREDFESRFIGTGDERQQLCAILESVLFLLQVNLNEIAASSNLDSIIISGGLARVDRICQGLADLSGLPVLRPDEAEATARGLAFLTAGRPASWQSPQAHRFAPADNNSVLRWRFSRWLEAMNQALQ